MKPCLRPAADKDSERRQREAVTAHAKAKRINIAEEFYDAAVSGADPIDTRKGFVALLERCKADGIKIVLVESASRFARDLAVQLTGHALMLRLSEQQAPMGPASIKIFRDAFTPTPSFQEGGLLKTDSNFGKIVNAASSREWTKHSQQIAAVTFGRAVAPFARHTGGVCAHCNIKFA